MSIRTYRVTLEYDPSKNCRAEEIRLDAYDAKDADYQARLLANSSVAVLRVSVQPEPRPSFIGSLFTPASWLQGEDFDRVLYAYRSWPVTDLEGTLARFEEVKAFIADRMRP